jgi:hypothetical protein
MLSRNRLTRERRSRKRIDILFGVDLQQDKKAALIALSEVAVIADRPAA